MKLSLVTTTFNSGKTVRDTLESVLRQTFTDYEYIIIDGASQDDTIAVIREYEVKFAGRLRWVSEPDGGIYDAMNKGLSMAKGEVLMLLNSDDMFSRPDVLSLVAGTFERSPEADGLYADLKYVSQYDTDKVVRVWKTGVQRPFRQGWHPAHPTFYVRRSIYERYGYFNLKYGLAADFDLMLRFVERYQIRLVYLPEILVKMRLGGTTNRSLRNIIAQNRECIAAFRDNGLPVGRFYAFYRLLPKIKEFFRTCE